MNVSSSHRGIRIRSAPPPAAETADDDDHQRRTSSNAAAAAAASDAGAATGAAATGWAPTTPALEEVGSADVVRLVQSHLLEVGLRGSVRALQSESGVKLPGQLAGGGESCRFHASSGNWGAVLEALSYVDLSLLLPPSSSSSAATSGDDLIAEVYEMTILELAEAGDLALAYATYRVVQPVLEKSEVVVHLDPLLDREVDESGEVDGVDEKAEEVEEEEKKRKRKSKSKAMAQSATKMSRARLLEQKLAALAASGSPEAGRTAVGAGHARAPSQKIPKDYYYGGDPARDPGNNSKNRRRSFPTRQDRRDDLGRRLQDAIPCIPRQRLPALLQQAILWQSHTGQLPRVRRLWHHPTTGSDDEGADADDRKDRGKEGTKRSRKEFDLVLGTVQVDPVPAGTQYLDRSRLPVEPIPRSPYSAVKFGKQARPESAAFLPSGAGLVTGSSDGLIEVWDAASQYKELLPTLEYQRHDRLMGHDNLASVTALAVSNDGRVLASGDETGCVKVWNVDTGTCVRSWQAHGSSSSTGAIACIALAPDASRVLTASRTGDGSCREFGLRTTRMLMDLSHPGSVTWCGYCVAAAAGTGAVSGRTAQHQDGGGGGDGERLLIVTASGDGAVRIWDRASQEILRTLRPVSSVGVPESSWSRPGASILTEASSAGARHDHAASIGSPSIHTVVMLHTPSSSLIVVPRGPRAFMVDLAGTVVRVFDSEHAAQSPAQRSCFVAAVASCTNQWLYAVTENGACCVFSVETGELETVIRDFGSETMRLPKDSGGTAGLGGTAEVTNIVHHPNRSVLAAFSNSKYQKKGQVVMWK